jgi:hypothetical protein
VGDAQQNGNKTNHPQITQISQIGKSLCDDVQGNQMNTGNVASQTGTKQIIHRLRRLGNSSAMMCGETK